MKRKKMNKSPPLTQMFMIVTAFVSFHPRLHNQRLPLLVTALFPTPCLTNSLFPLTATYHPPKKSRCLWFHQSVCLHPPSCPLHFFCLLSSRSHLIYFSSIDQHKLWPFRIPTGTASYSIGNTHPMLIFLPPVRDSTTFCTGTTSFPSHTLITSVTHPPISVPGTNLYNCWSISRAYQYHPSSPSSGDSTPCQCLSLFHSSQTDLHPVYPHRAILQLKTNSQPRSMPLPSPPTSNRPLMISGIISRLPPGPFNTHYQSWARGRD